MVHMSRRPWVVSGRELGGRVYPHHTLARHAPYTQTPRNECRTVRPGRRRASAVMCTAGWRPQQLSRRAWRTRSRGDSAEKTSMRGQVIPAARGPEPYYPTAARRANLVVPEIGVLKWFLESSSIASVNLGSESRF